MSALDNARKELKFQRGPIGSPTVAKVLTDLIAEHERVLSEMHQRELHHFETERLLTEAGIDPDVERSNTPAPDDEREALLAVLRGQGLSEPGFSPHSWRCEHPDRYPDFKCDEEMADAILASDVWRNRRKSIFSEPTQADRDRVRAKLAEISEARINAAAHALSEWLNDEAPIGEERYKGPARAALEAAEAK